MAEKPSALLKKYLAGNRDVPEAIKSWAQFFVYKKAVEVLGLPFSQRRGVIESSPLRGELEVEVKRIHKMRRDP